MENKLVLNTTELTGILGKEEMKKLSLEIGENNWKTYREKYDLASNLKILDFPIQLDFELNASCNLKCPMCPISAESPKGKGKKTWFDFEFFKEILDFSVKDRLQKSFGVIFNSALVDLILEINSMILFISF